MQKLLSVAFAAALIATPAFAQGTDTPPTAPLPAGPAAGTTQAGFLGSTTFWLVSAGVVAAAVAIPLSSGSHSSTTTTSGHH